MPYRYYTGLLHLIKKNSELKNIIFIAWKSILMKVQKLDRQKFD